MEPLPSYSISSLDRTCTRSRHGIRTCIPSCSSNTSFDVDGTKAASLSTKMNNEKTASKIEPFPFAVVLYAGMDGCMLCIGREISFQAASILLVTFVISCNPTCGMCLGKKVLRFTYPWITKLRSTLDYNN